MNHAKRLVSTVKRVPEMVDRFHDDAPEGTSMGEPEYHSGLSLTVNEEMMERLGLTDRPEKGQLVHLCCEAKVTGFHDLPGGEFNVMLQITDCGVPNDPEEEAEEERQERAERMYGNTDYDLGDD